MRLGRLFFAGAVLLGLGYFALRSPVPAADPRFIQKDFEALGPKISISVYLDTGTLRDRGNAVVADVAAQMRAQENDVPGALEAAAAKFRTEGIGNVMVRYGTNLVVRGKRGNAPWRIGLRNPRSQNPDAALAYLLADRDEAVATRGDARVVSVFAPDAAVAVAAARSLHDAPPGQWREHARKLGVEMAMVVEADGAVSVTPPLSERLKFLHGITPGVVP